MNDSFVMQKQNDFLKKYKYKLYIYIDNFYFMMTNFTLCYGSGYFFNLKKKNSPPMTKFWEQMLCFLYEYF